MTNSELIQLLRDDDDAECDGEGEGEGEGEAEEEESPDKFSIRKEKKRRAKAELEASRGRGRGAGQGAKLEVSRARGYTPQVSESQQRQKSVGSPMQQRLNVEGTPPNTNTARGKKQVRWDPSGSVGIRWDQHGPLPLPTLHAVVHNTKAPHRLPHSPPHQHRTIIAPFDAAV